MSQNGKHKHGSTGDFKVRLEQRKAERSRRGAALADDLHVKKVCLSKRVYASRNRARTAAKHATSKHGIEFSYYRCSHCGGNFHLTTEKPIPPSDRIIRPPSGTAITVVPLSRTFDKVKRMVRR